MTTVELPAPIGSKVYTTYYGEIQEHIITGYNVGADGVEDVYFKDKRDKTDAPKYVARLRHVDFTREDAEERLEAEK